MSIVDDVADLGDPAGVLPGGVVRASWWPVSPPALFVLSGVLRPAGSAYAGKAAERVAAQQSPKQVRKPKRRRSQDGDLDDMADIEAILKKHGI